MSRTKSLLLGTALSMFAYSAQAADLDLPADHESWTGFYVGAALGGGAAVAELSTPLIGGGSSLDGLGGEGFLASAFVGYDYQINPDYVVGLMADFTASNIEADLNIPGAPFSASFTGDTNFSVLARVGRLISANTMTYALAGYTHQNFDLDTSIGFGADFDDGGLTIGGGVEHRMDNNWSIRLEHRTTYFGGFTAIPGALEVDTTAHTIRLGMAYRWSDPDGIRPESDAMAVNWTGFHIGGGLGSTATIGEFNTPGVFTFNGIGGEGFQGGIHVGYDSQVNEEWVLGVEARATLSNSELEVTTGGATIFTIEQQPEFSITARAGYIAAPDTLLYGLAGYSWGEYEASIPGIGSVDLDFDGLTVGGGIEHAITENWTSRLEYRYTHFGDEDLFGVGINAKPSTHAVMSSISYRFNAEQ